MTPALFTLIALYCVLSVLCLAWSAVDAYRERKWRNGR